MTHKIETIVAFTKMLKNQPHLSIDFIDAANGSARNILAGQEIKSVAHGMKVLFNSLDESTVNVIFDT